LSDFIINEFDLIDEKNLVYSFTRKDQPYGGYMSDREMRYILLENGLCEEISFFQMIRVEYDGLKEYLNQIWTWRIKLPFYYRIWHKLEEKFNFEFPSRQHKIKSLYKAHTKEYLNKKLNK